MNNNLRGFGIYDERFCMEIHLGSGFLFGIKAWLFDFLMVFGYVMERHLLLLRRNGGDHYN